MKKKWILAILFSILGVFLVGSGIMILINGNSNKKTNGKQENENSVKKSGRFFDCTQDTYYRDGYKIDYLYHFYFIDNELQYGTLKYIYAFDSKEVYDTLTMDFSKAGVPVEEEFDEKNLIKTYDMKVQYPQEVQGDKAIESYLEKLKGLKYSCKEIFE